MFSLILFFLHHGALKFIRVHEGFLVPCHTSRKAEASCQIPWHKGCRVLGSLSRGV